TRYGLTRTGLPPAGPRQPPGAFGNFTPSTGTSPGKPLLTHRVIVKLIANTKTKTGLTVQCRLDRNKYEKGIKVSDAEMAKLNITRAEFHGEWNYTIKPRRAWK